MLSNSLINDVIRTMNQGNIPTHSRKKTQKNMLLSSRSNKHKLKNAPSSTTYVLANEALSKVKTESSLHLRLPPETSSSTAHVNKTNSNICFSGRRLWSSITKKLEDSATDPIRLNGTIEEESELIGILSKQLYLAESQTQNVQSCLSKAEQQLQVKDQEIDRLKRKVKEWEVKWKNQEVLRKKEQQEQKSQLDNSEYLYKRCLMLEHQIYEMEKFLADYGLVWVGDTNTSKEKETTADNYIETCYDQLIANIDQLNIAAGKGEVHVHLNEKGASFKTPSCISLKFYKNGMIVQEGPLRLYSNPKTGSFIRDILDGYFPSELQETYPNGVPFKVEDHRTEIYSSNGGNGFPGQGYRLGKQASNISTHKRKNSNCNSGHSSPRLKENSQHAEFMLPFITRSLKAKNSSEIQPVDIKHLRSQILASHNNICSDTHLQSHLNAELALSNRKEKRDLATKNTEYELSIQESTTKQKNSMIRFPSSGRTSQRSSTERLSSRLSPSRTDSIANKVRLRSRSASSSGRRSSMSFVSKTKTYTDNSSNIKTLKSLSSTSNSPRNPRATKSATQTRKPAPPILHQINEPSGRTGELRLKVRSLNGGTVYLVHLSADDSVARLYELLDRAVSKSWHKSYKIIISGYSPKRLDQFGLSLRESGITRDSVLHLVND